MISLVLFLILIINSLLNSNISLGKYLLIKFTLNGSSIDLILSLRFFEFSFKNSSSIIKSISSLLSIACILFRFEIILFIIIEFVFLKPLPSQHSHFL